MVENSPRLGDVTLHMQFWSETNQRLVMSVQTHVQGRVSHRGDNKRQKYLAVWVARSPDESCFHLSILSLCRTESAAANKTDWNNTVYYSPDITHVSLSSFHYTFCTFGEQCVKGKASAHIRGERYNKKINYHLNKPKIKYSFALSVQLIVEFLVLTGRGRGCIMTGHIGGGIHG